MNKVVFRREGLGDLLGGLKSLTSASGIRDSGMEVFKKQGVRRYASAMEVETPLPDEGEFIIASTGGSLNEVAKKLGNASERFHTAVGEEYRSTDVEGAIGTVLTNAVLYGSKGGEDVYVGWSVSKSAMAVTVIDQGKSEFDPFEYAHEALPERWLRNRDDASDRPDVGHVGILSITGKGIGGRQVKEPMVDYIEWSPLMDHSGGKVGTKTTLIFKPKAALK